MTHKRDRGLIDVEDEEGRENMTAANGWSGEQDADVCFSESLALSGGLSVFQYVAYGLRWARVLGSAVVGGG